MRSAVTTGFCIIALAIAAMLLLPRTASAQAWLSRPVTMLVPFPAGGTADLFAREIARAVGSPDLKEKMAAIGYEPSAVPPDEFKARIKADMPKWAKVIHDAGIRP